MATSGTSARRVLAIAAALFLGVTGCASDIGGTALPAPGAPSALAGPTTTAATGTTATAAPAAYTATSMRVSGDNGRVRYDVVLPQVAGGAPAVAGEFNESVRAALQDQIDGSPGERFTLEGRNESTVARIGARVLAGLLVTSWNADPPGAHPTPLVATVVIDADNAQPITLGALFPDLPAGLRRLSDESARLLPATAAGPGFDRSGIEPTEANFANWIPTPAGMEIHFADYQVGPHAAGLVVVTVPWDRLDDVIAPGLRDVVRS
ncbi:RsiV family protein [Rhodococcus sp. NPDC127528]|uniref:RsiV family protein n=1 Tax=unclassified Rhodococcus (in: high G+C Gram-positive bacteria) TaxID=192944 RepID=UPI0036359879